MASPKPCASVSEESELSDGEVQVLDSSEPLGTASSSSSIRSVVISCGSARVLDSIEPLGHTSRVQVLDSDEPLVSAARSSIYDDPVPGPSGLAGPSGSVIVGDSGGSTSGTVGSSRRSSLTDDDEPRPDVADAAASDNDEELAHVPVPRPTGSSGRRMKPNKAEISQMWNWERVILSFDTEDKCLQFAEDRGLLPPKKRMCRIHKTEMSYTKSAGSCGKYRCRKGTCRSKSVSRAKGTWFEKASMPLFIIFRIMYCFSENMTHLATMKNVVSAAYDKVVSSATVTDWFHFCREVVMVYELEHQRGHGKIGGPNKIVQIDESKFGKRKYNRGRFIEGHWVIGMIEDGSDDLRLEVCPNNERSAEILVPLIKKHVAEGSIIHTDYWRAYMSLPEHGYIHRRVNHSDPENRFVAPDGTHTQRIESQWRGLKQVFRSKQRKLNFEEWLFDSIWRRRIHVNHLDPFEELIKAIKYVYKIDL
ncbi:uncharacterized protein LOC125234096 [Leguminivora glycinivorella]|uniref:uncharacterized protein LOC125228411 n=1 Tax=Leguminivora glycinivorella TaxID=1035111 RepID=UPI0020107CFE|nr:uncharacterized protein LOC125228411 [Leguminivora glycinivorella]XP_047996237.1 uncharacterized protein LOC125234096 [Leguminivora glycinivorella]